MRHGCLLALEGVLLCISGSLHGMDCSAKRLYGGSWKSNARFLPVCLGGGLLWPISAAEEFSFVGTGQSLSVSFPTCVSLMAMSRTCLLRCRVVMHEWPVSKSRVFFVACNGAMRRDMLLGFSEMVFPLGSGMVVHE